MLYYITIKIKNSLQHLHARSQTHRHTHTPRYRDMGSWCLIKTFQCSALCCGLINALSVPMTEDLALCSYQQHQAWAGKHAHTHAHMDTQTNTDTHKHTNTHIYACRHTNKHRLTHAHRNLEWIMNSVDKPKSALISVYWTMT